MKPETFDKERISLNLARLKKAGSNFEIDIDPDKALDYVKGRDVDILEVIKAENIFFDAKKGLLASEEKLESVFGTKDVEKIADLILREGEIQLTAEHRKQMQEKRYNKAIDIVHKNSVDPKSNLPHPRNRIENAFEEAKIRLDDRKSVDEQISDIVKKLTRVMPLKFGTAEIALSIPATHAAKCYSVLRAYGTLKNEEWKSDGSWYGLIEIPSGMQTEFYDKLNNLTQGEAEAKLMKTR